MLGPRHWIHAALEQGWTIRRLDETHDMLTPPESHECNRMTMAFKTVVYDGRRLRYPSQLRKIVLSDK